MWKRSLIKNKICAVLLILAGALTVLIDGDATFFFFALVLGLTLFFARENYIISLKKED